ncbi:MAG: type II secretion system protein GspF, partial [Candidatus Hydrogenedentota bacterium]
MAVFEYEAIAASGKSVKGVIDADTAAGARRKLREQQLYPTTVTETFEKETAGASREITLGGGRVKLRDITVFTR